MADRHEKKHTIRLQTREETDLRSFFDNAVEGMFRKSRNGTFILVNQALARIFGYPSPGRMLRDFPKDRENILLDASLFIGLLEKLKTYGQISDYELQFRRTDGLLVWALINARAVYTTKGSIRYYEGTLVDITARKEAEEQRAFIEEQTCQSRHMDSISILAGGMAADFGTHLLPILRHTEAALQMLPDASPVHQELATVLSAANHTKTLMNQFLAISRQRDGQKRPVSLTPIIVDVVDDFRSRLPEHILLEEDLAAQPDTVLADPAQLRLIIENLLTNAMESIPASTTEKGNITVSLRDIDLDEQTAAFRADLIPGYYIRLTVQDTGKGIADEILHRVFDPFFTTHPKVDSQGLGLSVAHGIARSHDGGITVLSEPELGSTFCLYLPCHAMEVDQSRPLAPAPRLGSERILIVDPSPQELRKWRGLLAPLGYQVETLSGSVEALRAFMEMPEGFDLVVTAFSMPQINGMELSRTLLGIREDIPIALCRESSDPVTVDMARQAGICFVARKPLETQTIHALLETALDSLQEE